MRAMLKMRKNRVIKVLAKAPINSDGEWRCDNVDGDHLLDFFGLLLS
jgi:hypothetical protein